jgi:hypothetical protein
MPGKIGRVRNFWAILGLTMLTFGIYWLYWLYRTIQDIDESFSFSKSENIINTTKVLYVLVILLIIPNIISAGISVGAVTIGSLLFLVPSSAINLAYYYYFTRSVALAQVKAELSAFGIAGVYGFYLAGFLLLLLANMMIGLGMVSGEIFGLIGFVLLISFTYKIVGQVNRLWHDEKGEAKTLTSVTPDSEKVTALDDDSLLYKQAYDEFQSGRAEEAVWIKALTETEGDEEKAKYHYIKLRARQLAKEHGAPSGGNSETQDVADSAANPDERHEREIVSELLQRWHMLLHEKRVELAVQLLEHFGESVPIESKRDELERQLHQKLEALLQGTKENSHTQEYSVQQAPQNQSQAGVEAFDNHVFKSDEWGIKFIIPPEVTLYTGDNPGAMASRINSTTPLWLVNSALESERINLKISEDNTVTEADLDEFKQELDKGTPYSSTRQYRKLSVKYIDIGKDGRKHAIEHIHALKQREPKKLRQVIFVHRGKLFSFTSATTPERFDGADKDFFSLIFNSMEFA